MQLEILSLTDNGISQLLKNFHALQAYHYTQIKSATQREPGI